MKIEYFGETREPTPHAVDEENENQPWWQCRHGRLVVLAFFLSSALLLLLTSTLTAKRGSTREQLDTRECTA